MKADAILRDPAKEWSESAVETIIRLWRYARTHGDSLGWPESSILGRVQEMGPFAVSGARGSKPPPVGMLASERDAIAVQKVVNDMPPHIKAAFESYHIGVIRGESARTLPHAARALTLGIDRQTYYARVKDGKRILQARIGEYIDFSDRYEA